MPACISGLCPVVKVFTSCKGIGVCTSGSTKVMWTQGGGEQAWIGGGHVILTNFYNEK